MGRCPTNTLKAIRAKSQTRIATAASVRTNRVNTHIRTLVCPQHTFVNILQGGEQRFNNNIVDKVNTWSDWNGEGVYLDIGKC